MSHWFRTGVRFSPAPPFDINELNVRFFICIVRFLGHNLSVLKLEIDKGIVTSHAIYTQIYGGKNNDDIDSPP